MSDTFYGNDYQGGVSFEGMLDQLSPTIPDTTDKKTKILNRASQITRDLSLKEDMILITYPTPDTGFNGRYNTTKGGMVKVDFPNGNITVIDPTSGLPRVDQLNGRLDSIRSLLLFISDGDAVVTLDGKPIMWDMTLWHLLEDVKFSVLQINFPTAPIPNNFAFMFVACNKPNMGFKNSLFVGHDVRVLTAQTTTDANVVTFLRHVFGYDNAILVTKNTGANVMTITAEESPDEVNFYNITGYPKDLAAGATDELDILIKYHYLRVSNKSKVLATPTTFDQNLQAAR